MQTIRQGNRDLPQSLVPVLMLAPAAGPELTATLVVPGDDNQVKGVHPLRDHPARPRFAQPHLPSAPTAHLVVIARVVSFFHQLGDIYTFCLGTIKHMIWPQLMPRQIPNTDFGGGTLRPTSICRRPAWQLILLDPLAEGLSPAIFAS